MPLTGHGSRMKARLEAEYGKTKGDSVLYASRNAGKPAFQGIDDRPPVSPRGGNALKRRMADHAAR